MDNLYNIFYYLLFFTCIFFINLLFLDVKERITFGVAMSNKSGEFCPSLGESSTILELRQRNKFACCTMTGPKAPGSGEPR